MQSVIRKIIQILITIGFMIGMLFLADFILTNVFMVAPATKTYWIVTIIAVILTGVLFFFISPFVIKFFEKFGTAIANRVAGISLGELVGSTVGLILGLVIAVLIGSAFKSLVISTYISVGLCIFLGYVGLAVGMKKGRDIPLSRRLKNDKDHPAREINIRPSVLDTSVIIDGRIADIYRAGFIPGPMVVPNFVLDELKRVADSSDPLKKSRGRRGLDILNTLRQEDENAIEVVDKDYDDIKEVDLKLIRLTQDLKGQVFTNDFNLNKMAQVQNVKVLNINDLANAVKTIVLPGEELVVRVLREGKEADQGVAYLDDGTMIVVENGRHYVGVTLSVVATSVLQTTAGRMIFAKPK